MIVHFNGMPGTGKRTVAVLLSQRLPGRLVDNHSIINEVIRTHQHGSPAYIEAVKAETGRILRLYPDEPLIFTNALAAERAEDRARLDQIADFARESGRVFWQILFGCDLEENQRRIVSPQRGPQQKLTDPVVLEGLHRDYTIYHPPAAHRLELDVTRLTAEQAADQLVELLAIR
ncbi:hypothetical protein ABS71_15440 [bacterium SCN 62-11]|nr:hypothetical protein [Candidatus Eremiobacteraeota bacterium]ODT62652.1 MAG: hypothetical protein ABS71_15440 [bacterium SCN 62-11]